MKKKKKEWKKKKKEHKVLQSELIPDDGQDDLIDLF